VWAFVLSWNGRLLVLEWLAFVMSGQIPAVDLHTYLCISMVPYFDFSLKRGDVHSFRT